MKVAIIDADIIGKKAHRFPNFTLKSKNSYILK